MEAWNSVLEQDAEFWKDEIDSDVMMMADFAIMLDDLLTGKKTVDEIDEQYGDRRGYDISRCASIARSQYEYQQMAEEEINNDL